MVVYSDILIKIIGAFLILILGLILLQIVKNIMKKFFKGIELNKMLEEKFKLKNDLEGILIIIITVIIDLIIAILVLNQLGIPTKILQLILIIFLILVTIFIIFAFKDWVPNIISGLYLIKTNKIKIGEIIKIKDLKGKVIAINLLETQIETNNNELIFIPNSNITKYEVTKVKKNG